ncbi:ABC transporter permease subunit [Kitasatospora sp. GP82]|uniref:ABC transporter permease n=1 Tax=Kitasatospora sp. GP82 TaxID=3035089 RepID=UPI0024739883|nr:ABC transporter permease subunit [Kitasatospora sp. GP82]MDH6126015.1 ABC-type transport system involved in multi-copper enzyme maturation permease subunit [Kitasatospora sp. GP82]
MTWLTWRQFRMQLLVALAALSAVTAYLLISGFQLHNAYNSALAGCPNGGCSPVSQLTTQYRFPYYLGTGLVLLVPGLIGAFWGAPLIARELETGTHRLIWNQSITRTRWLAVKLVFIGLAAAVTTGLLSLLVSWFASPLDRINNNRFTPLLFSARGVVPLSYAAFAVALGTCVGLLIRRSVPAMAATLAVFAAVQILVPLAVRPHLESPVRGDVALTSEAMKSASLIGFTNRTPAAPFVADLNVPGAWVLSGAEPVRTSSGQALTMATQPCATVSDAAAHDACLANADLHVTVSYQPADRYWAFQWSETAIFLALTAGLVGFSAWWLRGRLA